MTQGTLTINELVVIECDTNPTITPGLFAPIGSLALLDGAARKWQKFGPLATDWKEDNVALNISFDNSTNGFLANEVQHAIEETKSYNEGFPRAGIPLTSNGTLNNGSYITYTELLANPRILFPVAIRLKELTWVNANTSVGSFTFQIYKNGQLAGDLFYTYTPTATDRTNGYGYFVFPTNLDFAAGDSMYIKYLKPSGIALSDLALVVWISRLP